MSLAEECYEYGFHNPETDGTIKFRWCTFEASILLLDAPGAYIHLDLYSDFFDRSQVVECFIDGKLVKRLQLAFLWNTYTIPRIPGKRLVLKINKKIEAPLDPRTLTVRLGNVEFSDTPETPKSIITQNTLLNTEEFMQGKIVLQSYPVRLGIDINGTCNIKPSCVYCEFDDAKRKEGAFTHAPFTLDTLKEYGSFFTHCAQLTNCSIGEPFLSPQIAEILDAFETNGKMLEMSTNGILLNAKNRALLIGKHINLYISIDAATPETYAKLRSNAFTRIIDNIRALIQERGLQSAPAVYLVFMPMRLNVHELEDFIKLCADLKVDVMILRPLYDSFTPGPLEPRGGHVFDYHKEKFSREERIPISIKARKLAKKYGVRLVDQLNFQNSIEEELLASEQDTAAPDESAVRTCFAQCDSACDSSSGSSGDSPHDSLRDSSGDSATPVASSASAHAAPSPQRSTFSAKTAKLAASASKIFRRDTKLVSAPPICREPWESGYILRAGVKFCCYSYRPLGPMDKYKELWNCDMMQEIRAHLAQGGFSKYCLESKSCPIVQKYLTEHPEAEVKTIHEVMPRKVHGLFRKLVH